jgi:hypothetical protein
MAGTAIGTYVKRAFVISATKSVETVFVRKFNQENLNIEQIIDRPKMEVRESIDGYQ